MLCSVWNPASLGGSALRLVKEKLQLYSYKLLISYHFYLTKIYCLRPLW
ncbi:hypothetical protein RchiOBHm_Chr3g0485481 [Rosa chinensis]|uniref:Uncharacterized protein n=1 Tax=Rosa chinensis TaxID=74649 RepID=A0A2P6REZ9_ROSCH|nr:hypothetical protein RchiOBHm_Chr3g0485481 [Rosa chinensis]